MIEGLPTRAMLESRIVKRRYREKLKSIEPAVSRCRDRHDVAELLMQLGWEEHEVLRFQEIAWEAHQKRHVQ